MTWQSHKKGSFINIFKRLPRSARNDNLSKGLLLRCANRNDTRMELFLYIRNNIICYDIIYFITVNDRRKCSDFILF